MEIFFGFAAVVGSIWGATAQQAYDYHQIQPQQQRYEQAAQDTQKTAQEIQRLVVENTQLHQQLCRQQECYKQEEEYYLATLEMAKVAQRVNQFNNTSLQPDNITEIEELLVTSETNMTKYLTWSEAKKNNNEKVDYTLFVSIRTIRDNLKMLLTEHMLKYPTAQANTTNFASNPEYTHVQALRRKILQELNSKK